jgi:hypothetical protein
MKKRKRKMMKRGSNSGISRLKTSALQIDWFLKWRAFVTETGHHALAFKHDFDKYAVA